MTNLLVLYIVGEAVPKVLLADGVPYSALLHRFKAVVQNPPEDASRIELWRSGPGRVKLKHFPVRHAVPNPSGADFNAPPESEKQEAGEEEVKKSDKVEDDKNQRSEEPSLLEVPPTKQARKNSATSKDK